MTLTLILFIVFAVVLILILWWAASPSRSAPLTPDEVLERLSEERHYARMPQILQCLREEDTNFIGERGHKALLTRMRAERQSIALRYLSYLEDEYRVLQECFRILATMSPELPARREFERLQQNLKFTWNCTYLRWRIRLGMQPWDLFGTLGDMAGTLTLQLEAATARLGEQALLSGETNLVADQRRDGSK
jgi:hypothetical protein